MMKQIYRIMTLIISLFSLPLIAYNVIFDFNGVLMGTNRFATIKQIGIGNVMQCMFHLKKSPFCIDSHLKTKFFTVLNWVSNIHQFDQNKSIITYDETGNQLPYLMRAWLDGSMTCKKIKKYTFQSIEQHPEWFDHTSEKNAICNLINTIFTPHHFVKTRTIHQKCVAFIKACKKQGHKIFALSNWDKESFVLLQKKYTDIFDLFDGIVISGDVNSLKPCSDIYQLLLNKYNLQPKTCWFIDDQQENVTAASKLGIHGVLCHQTTRKTPNFHRVAQTIKSIVSAHRDYVSNEIVMATKQT